MTLFSSFVVFISCHSTLVGLLTYALLPEWLGLKKFFDVFLSNCCVNLPENFVQNHCFLIHNHFWKPQDFQTFSQLFLLCAVFFVLSILLKLLINTWLPPPNLSAVRSSSESRKNLEQKFIFKTAFLIPTASKNAFHSITCILFLFSALVTMFPPISTVAIFSALFFALTKGQRSKRPL